MSKDKTKYIIKQMFPDQSGARAGYVGDEPEDDVLVPIICWALVGDPLGDRIAAMITVPGSSDLEEADEVEGFVGLFLKDERNLFRIACIEARGDDEDEEDYDGEPLDDSDPIDMTEEGSDE